MDAIKSAVEAQLALTPKFRPTEWTLQYTQTDIDKFLPTA